jgi:hypothetical protein
MALATRRGHLTLQIRVLYRASPCEIFYGKGSTGPGFSASIVLWLSPIRIVPPVLYTHLHLNNQICLVGCMFLLMLHLFSGIRIKIHTKELLMSHFSLIKWAGSLPPETHLMGLEKHLLG